MRELVTLFEIISAISSTLASDEVLAHFTEKTAQMVGVGSCAISRWERELDAVIVLADYIAPEAMLSFDDNVNDVGAAYPLDYYPATAQVLHEQTPLIVYADDPAADNAEKELLDAFGWDGVLMVPMLYKGQALGLLELYSTAKEHDPFSDDDVSLCQALANQVAVAIENARLYQEAEEGRLRAEAMQVISRVLASELDYQRIMRNAANFAYRLVNALFVYIAVPENDGFRPVASAGRDTSEASIPHTTGLTLPLPGRETFTRAVRGPIVVPDTHRDPTFIRCQEEIKGQSWRTIVAVPLLSYNQVVGVLAAYAEQPNFFTPNDVAVLMSLASQAAVAVQNARLFGELEAKREALHHVSLRLVNAQEEERRRISRELHDELGQALTALKINLDIGRRALPRNASSKLRHSIHEASSLAVKTLETARNLSLELHPAILDDLGLVAALRWEIDRYEKRMGQTIHFKTEPADIALPPELEITIYRIVIEALTNIARHAQANQISVYLQLKDHQVVTSIEDDGVGFDAVSWFNSPAERQSLGLIGMRERAELLGGQFEVISEPGGGTKIRVKLPTSD